MALTFQQLSTNADKKSACLACKQMQILVTPLLYRDMEIFANRLDETLLATLKEDHPGLPQVRTLRIRSLGLLPLGSMWSDDMQMKIILRLLHTIPKHFLTRFEYGRKQTRVKKDDLIYISGSRTRALSVLESDLLFAFVRRRSVTTNLSVV